MFPVLFYALAMVVAALLALAISVVLIWASTNAIGGAVLLLATLALETSSTTPLAIRLGLWLYLPDLIAGLLALALIYRVAVLGKGRQVPLAWWVLGVVQAGLFAWGLAKYGTGAGVDYRQHFYIWVGAAYFATFQNSFDFSTRLLRLFIPFAVVLSSIAAYRWVMGALDWQFQRELDALVTTGIAYRVIWSQPTLIVAMAMLICVHLATTARRPSGSWVLVAMFGSVVVVLQHRSVWVSGMAGLLTLVFAGSYQRVVQLPRLSGALIGLAAALVITVAGLKGSSESIQLQAGRAVSSSGTFAGRVSGWRSLLTEWFSSRSPITYAVGKPFGSGYTRYSSTGAQITYQPHNYYVHLLYRGGLIGLSCFLWIAIAGLKSLLQALRRGEPNASLHLALTVGLLLYYIPYAMTYDHAILLGLLLCAIARDRATPDREKRRQLPAQEGTAQV